MQRNLIRLAFTLAIAALPVTGFAGPVASLELSDETLCPPPGEIAVSLSIDTVGAPLGALDAGILFDDDNLEVLGVFPGPFVLSSYSLFWNVLELPGEDVLDIGMFTGTPTAPAAGEQLVTILFRVNGPAGSYALTWDPGRTFIDEVTPSVLDDGSVTTGVGDVAIFVPEGATAAPATTTVVPVLADPADGLSSFDITLEFDPTVLEYRSVEIAGLVTEDFTLTANRPEPGRLLFSLFRQSGSPIPPGTGEAVIADVLFDVIGTLGDATDLDLTRTITDDGISVCAEDGLLLVCPDLDGDGATTCPTDPEDCDDLDPDIYPGAPEICDGKDNECPGDPGFGQVDETFDPDGDGLAACFDNCPDDPNPLQEDGDSDAVGDVCDNCPTIENGDQADTDSDGFGDVCDLCPADANPQLADVEIRVPRASGAPGAFVEVPVVVDPADDLSSFDVTVEFDPAVIAFDSAQTTPTTADFTLFVNNPTASTVLLSLFKSSGSPIPAGTGEAEIATLIFEVVGSLGDTSPLDLTQGVSDDDVTPCTTDGIFEICPDDDGDGVTACPIDPDDCNDMNPMTSSAPPAAVDDSMVAGRTGSVIELAWDDEGLIGSFRLYRGFRDPDMVFGYNHTCMDAPFAAPMYNDGDVPVMTRLFYYLVSRQDLCGESGLGTDSDGVERPNDDPCTSLTVDADLDGVAEALDVCPGEFDPAQDDADADGDGDACDNCPADFNPRQVDLDMDGAGDACDPDDDGDGVPDGSDNCPTLANPTQDNQDGDIHGDVCDTCPEDADDLQADNDHDGTADVCDNCPSTSNPDQSDGDDDGVGDACDPTP